MKNLSLETFNVIPMTDEELFTIDGGAPSSSTGFWYDISWAVNTGVKALYNGFVDLGSHPEQAD